MATPSMPGSMYQTNGLEHDEQGRPDASFVVHQKMNDKRYRKLEAIAARYPLFQRSGSTSPKLGVICWGSTAGPVREAIGRLGQRDDIGVFIPQMLAPLPSRDLQQFLNECEAILVIEMTHPAQFHQYLRSQVDLPRGRTSVYCRSGGKAFTAAEIAEALQHRMIAEVATTEEVYS